MEARANNDSNSARQTSATAATPIGIGRHQWGINTIQNTTKNQEELFGLTQDEHTQEDEEGLTVQNNEQDFFGDQLPHKADGILRLGSVNINSYPMTENSDWGRAKMEKLRAVLGAGEFDAIAVQEWNKYWPDVPTEERPQERMRRWFKRPPHINLAYLKEAKHRKGQHLHGGTGVISIDEAACRIRGMGRDPSGMGRWCYTRYQGKGGKATRFYSAYRPCKSASSSGGLTVYSQQISEMVKKDDLRCPRVAFLDDLRAEIGNALSLGDKIVIGADLNTDLRSRGNSSTDLGFFIQNLQLSEVILSRHNSEPPPTFLMGSYPIDTILVSKGLDVVGCGYLDSETAVGDHRILWADITYNSALGHTEPFIASMDSRRLTLVDPAVVTMFNRLLKKEIKDNNIDVLTERILESVRKDPTNLDGDEFNIMITILVKAMKKAERKCRRFKTGTIKWFPLLSRAMKSVTYIRMAISYHKGERIQKRFLKQIRPKVFKKFRINFAAVPIDQCYVLLRKAKELLKKITREDETGRKDYIRGLAERRSEKGESSAEAEYRNLINREEQREMHRAIRTAYPSKKAKGIEAVTVRDSDNPEGPRIKLDKREDIEIAALNHLNWQYTQVYGTPSLSEDFIHHFGLDADTPDADAVLNGTFVFPPGMDPYVVALLKQMKRPESMKDIPAEITAQEYIDMWNKPGERTSSAPGNAHFGCFKATAQDNFLSSLMAQIMSIPLITGFAPEQYKTMTACLLEKKPGMIEVERLRIIMLLDALYSGSCRILAYRTMIAAEKHNMIAKEQYGCRRGLDALLQSINLRLIMDISVQKRIPMTIVCNDAKGCFDRIIHSIASLCFRKMGNLRGPLLCRFSSTRDLVVNLRTAFGDSEMTNRDAVWLVPFNKNLQGMLQGSPDGPCGWAIVSTAVLDALRDMGFGIAFKMAVTGDTVKLLGCMFVDDGTFGQTSTTNDPNDVMERTQLAQTAMEGLLKATGGAFDSAKGFWYMIDFKWIRGKWSYRKMNESPGVLRVKDMFGNLQTIERVDAAEARKQLGVWSAPFDDGKKQTAVLRKKADEWANAVRNTRLKPNHQWTGMTTGIMKGLEWPLPAHTLTKKQCSYIMSPILITGLRLSGVQSRIKRKIVFGSKDILGLGLPHLYTTAGIRRLIRFMDHAHTDSNTGQLMRTTLQQLLLEIGVGGNIFRRDHNEWKFITTKSWISMCWKFASENRLCISGPLKLITRRENDAFLMEHFWTKGITGKQLISVNRVRQYLQVLTISDIASPEGGHIMEDYLEGQAPKHQQSWHDWPAQKRPITSDWYDWLRALATLTELGSRRKLVVPLGKWNDGQKDKWEWFYSTTDDRLYRKEPGAWIFYGHSHGPRGRPKAGYFSGRGEIEEDDLPLDLQRTKVKDLGGRFRSMGVGPMEEIVQHAPPTPDFKSWLDTQDDTAKYLLKNLKMSDHEARQIASDIRQGSARLVSDGSYFPKTNIAAFQLRLESQNKETHIECAQYIPGMWKDNNAYRAEIAGILAALLLLEGICKTQHIDEGMMKIGCDCLGATRKAYNQDWVVNTSDDHYDIMARIHESRDKIPVQIISHYVRAHADDRGVPFHEMDRYTQLNVLCDWGAKDLAIIAPPEDRPTNVHLNRWCIELGGIQIINDIESHISKAIHDSDLKQYWADKHFLPALGQPFVDWEALSKATKSAGRLRVQNITKLFSENCATGVVMVTRGKRDTDKCVMCGEPEETVRHCLRCQDARSKKRWERSIRSLGTWLDSVHTNPLLTSTILEFLRKWHIRQVLDHIPPRFEELFEEQYTIGWQSFLFGFISSQWQLIQQRHYAMIGSRRTGLRWASLLIQKLWEVSWDQWNHRNGILHGRGNRLDEYEHMDEVDQEIRVEFARGRPNPCPRHYRQHFDAPSIGPIMALPNFQRRAWLETAQMIRKKVQDIDFDGLAPSRRIMHRFLRTCTRLREIVPPAP